MRKIGKLLFLFLCLMLLNINVKALDLEHIDKDITINPEYTKYLKSSPSKRGDLVPVPFITTYSDSNYKLYDAAPSSYDLRNVGGMNFTTPNKNQGNLGICWSYGTNAALESYLLKKSNTSYSSSAKLFSERQLDYATSVNGINNYTNKFTYFNSRNLGDGGNIYIASEAMANGVGSFYQSSFKNDYTTNTMELADVINYNNSAYELNSFIMMPILDGKNLDLTNPTNVQKRENYLNEVKNYIMQYGVAYVGTTSSQSGCAYYDSSLANYVIDEDKTCSISGHAMAIIGWNDNIEYSYCASNSSKHEPLTSSCPSNKIVRGKGVWILKNSWGTNHPYPYLTYDSLNVDIAFITDVNLTSSRTWDNNYVLQYSNGKPTDGKIYGYSLVKHKLSNEYIPSDEKLEKVKFMTYQENTSFKVYIQHSNGTTSIVKNVSYPEPGLHTVDFHNDNVLVNKNDTLIIQSTTTGTYSYVMDYAYVFTSNINKGVSASANPLTVNSKTTAYRLYTKTKNIPSGTTVSYKLLNSNGADFASQMKVANNKVGANEVYASLTFSGDIPIGTYTLYTVYNGGSYPTTTVNINSSSLANYTIAFNSNGGTGSMSSIPATAGYAITLPKNTFTRSGYTFAGWNTKADGTGTTYKDGASITLTPTVNSTVILYAMWTQNGVNPTGVTLNVTNLTLNVGNSQTLVATVTPTTATNKTITWISSNPEVASVDANGKVTALKAGSTVITAKTFNNITAIATVTVKDSTVNPSGIKLNINSVSLRPNGTYTLVATITPSNATNKTVTWTSSNTSVATVDASGKVTALTLGTTVITATTSNGLKATATVTVSNNDISTFNIEEIPTKAYTAKAITPDVKITYNNVTLVKDKDYKLTYKNNKNVGTATVTITGIGNYFGTVTKTFKIAIGIPKTLTNKSQNTSSITLSWGKASGKITGYQVYYSTKKDSGFKKIKTITKNSTVSYKKTGLSANKVYYFKVRSYYKTSKKTYYSSFTPVVGFTTATKTPSIKVSSTVNSATIKWSSISGATSYDIYQSTDKKKYTKVGTTATTSYVVSNLKSAKTYYYKVRAVKAYNSKNVNSAYSKVVSGTTKPAQPVISLKGASTSVTIKWNKVSGASGYEIYQSTDGNKYTKIKTITKGSTISFKKTKLTNSKAYYYKVRAYKKVGSKKVYSTFSTTTFTVTSPKAPKLKVSTSSNAVKVSWAKVSGASAYEVYVSNVKDSGYVLLTVTKDLNYMHLNLNSASTYYYRVRAIKNVNSVQFNGTLATITAKTKSA